MRNKPRFKTALVIGIFFFSFCARLSAQSYLNVPPIGQLNSRWCWAASMEMVTSFHGSTLTQCDFATRYYEFKKWRFQNMTNVISIPNGCCNTPCNGTTPNSLCNKTIYFSKRDGKVNLHYMDLIFSSFGYSSIEDVDTPWMTWGNIEKEIKACRPFMILLNKLDKRVQPTMYNHVVVAKGYYDTGVDKYVLVNDPQAGPASCSGCELLLPISIFSASTTDLNSALEVVRFIHPKDKDVCEDCGEPELISSNELVSIIEDENPDLFFGIENTTITNDELEGYRELIANDQEVYFIDEILFSGSEAPVTILIAAQTSPRIALWLQPVEDNWKISGVTLEKCTPFVEEMMYRDSKTNEIVTLRYDEFDTVVFLPDNYTFYKVEIKGKIYLVPAEDYPGLPFKKGDLYKEKIVLKGLTKISRSQVETTNPLQIREVPLNYKKLLKSVRDVRR